MLQTPNAVQLDSPSPEAPEVNSGAPDLGSGATDAIAGPVIDWLHFASVWGAVITLAWLANLIAKQVLVRGVRHLIGKTRAQWDDVFVEHRVFEKLSHLAPAMVFYAASDSLFPAEYAEYAPVVRRLANVWMILAGARAFGALLDALVDLGNSSEGVRDKPLQSYSQVLKLILWIAVSILVVATLMDKSPWALLTGLGAMTAILLLVFKDTILGFVASVQITANDMLRRGDWVEMGSFGADGDVISIGLHTVKVQNWNKTITTIPTPAFMTHSFRNWRGMTEGRGRRIKRSLAIDVHSVRFLEDEDIERLSKVQLLRSYLPERQAEIVEWNDKNGFDGSSRANGRRMTNLGTFRVYLDRYLRAHPAIREDMTFLVRQLPVTSEGVPIELYVFSEEKRWIQYESIVGDVFDHALAIVGEFDLRVFQRPAGTDVRALDLAALRGE